jgi:hypothetical protein
MTTDVRTRTRWESQLCGYWTYQRPASSWRAVWRGRVARCGDRALDVSRDTSGGENVPDEVRPDLYCARRLGHSPGADSRVAQTAVILFPTFLDLRPVSDASD